jgi:hypothetical protein
MIVGDWTVLRGEMRSFTVPDEKGGTREELVLGIHMTIFHPVRSNMTVEMDSKWFNEDPVGQQIDKSKVSFAPRVLSEFVLYDSAGEQYSTLQRVVNDEVAIMKADKIDTKHIIHRFEKDTFFKPDSPEIPPVKISAIAFDILIEKTERPAHCTLKTSSNSFSDESQTGLNITSLPPNRNHLLDSCALLWRNPLSFIKTSYTRNINDLAPSSIDNVPVRFWA